jgi:Uma2 family endonuclease
MSTTLENWPRRHRLTVDEYYRMAEVGLLAPDARVELIEGEIIDMPPIGMPHGSVVDRLNQLMIRAVGDRAIVRVQGAIRLSRFSQPQPDLALLAPSANFYADKHPTAADTLLIIEVSDTTLRYDSKVKASLYARHGVPEYWIVDLDQKQLHFLRTPTPEGYVDVSADSSSGPVSIAALPGVSIDLNSLLSHRRQ